MTDPRRPSPEVEGEAIAGHLAELEALARRIARGHLPNRGDAMDYLRVRQALLASSASGLMPGFVYQCMSVHRLRDFVMLYDPEAELRERFMTRAFAAARGAIAERSVARSARTGTGTWSL